MKKKLTDDQKFINSLRQDQKVYTVFERPYWHENGDWEGIAYDKPISKLRAWIIRLMGGYI